MSQDKERTSERAGGSAAEWFVDVIDNQGGRRINTEAESQLVKWLETDSAHEDELARCEAAIDIAGRLRSDEEIRWAFVEAAQIAASAESPAAVHIGRWFRNPAVAWSVAAICAVLAVIGFANDLPQPPAAGEASVQTPPQANLALALASTEPVVVLPGHVIVDARSVAVLPFVGTDADPFGDAAADRLATALHGDVVKRLAAIPGVYVIGRESVAAYEGSNIMLQEIATQLGVRGVVEGSVTSDAERVRVVLRLTDAATDKLLMQTVYERPTDEMNAIEAEMVTNIAVALARSSRTGQAASQQQGDIS